MERHREGDGCFSGGPNASCPEYGALPRHPPTQRALPQDEGSGMFAGRIAEP